jgi:hypothetical protein
MKVVKISCMLMLSFMFHAFSLAKAFDVSGESFIIQVKDFMEQSSGDIGNVPEES